MSKSTISTFQLFALFPDEPINCIVGLIGDYVLANIQRPIPSIFNFYQTSEDAAADMERANGPEWLDWGPYAPMTYAEFEAAKRAKILADPPCRISAEKWNEMLEILPPLRWEQHFDFNSFLMSEMLSGSYTHQYARYGHGDGATYWTKIVDAADRETWMKKGECPCHT